MLGEAGWWRKVKVRGGGLVREHTLKVRRTLYAEILKTGKINTGLLFLDIKGIITHINSPVMGIMYS